MFLGRGMLCGRRLNGGRSSVSCPNLSHRGPILPCAYIFDGSFGLATGARLSGCVGQLAGMSTLFCVYYKISLCLHLQD
ncbi:hypothetical protein L211DRAFT_570723 [Terfezia boudieri ATCC MYA-4762]|uniref:Uncharacterized protein n=1 Tax=Terfezia boudieri ATCC MYA-4762 TaxID=1051890 RepID=A0A3N4LQ92_9PEZI|nr:hypothetical protein L211DRAFT_570723 [Terfezia boudieri ATCC MYA-4762]